MVEIACFVPNVASYNNLIGGYIKSNAIKSNFRYDTQKSKICGCWFTFGIIYNKVCQTHAKGFLSMANLEPMMKSEPASIVHPENTIKWVYEA